MPRLRHRQTKGAATVERHLPPPRQSSTLPSARAFCARRREQHAAARGGTKSAIGGSHPPARTASERVQIFAIRRTQETRTTEGCLHCCRAPPGYGKASGLNATAVQNPLTTLPEAVASAQRVLARQDGPTVLVGHSFAGMIVTEAGMHPNVSALVYVAARAPDAGEDYTALAKRFPTPAASAGIVFDGDEGRLGEEAFLRDFAGDLPEAKAKVLYAVQEPFQKALLTGKTTYAAWQSKPSFYAVSTEDHAINPDLERFMAKRMGAKTIEVRASHLSMIPIQTRSPG